MNGTGHAERSLPLHQAFSILSFTYGKFLGNVVLGTAFVRMIERGLKGRRHSLLPRPDSDDMKDFLTEASVQNDDHFKEFVNGVLRNFYGVETTSSPKETAPSQTRMKSDGGHARVMRRSTSSPLAVTDGNVQGVGEHDDTNEDEDDDDCCDCVSE